MILLQKMYESGNTEVWRTPISALKDGYVIVSREGGAYREHATRKTLQGCIKLLSTTKMSGGSK